MANNLNAHDETSYLLTSEEKTRHEYSDLEEAGRHSNMSKKASPVTRFGRTALVATFVCLALTFWTWKWYLRAGWEEGWTKDQGFLINAEEKYSMAKNTHFDGVRIQDLDPSILPGGDADPEGKRRLIFVGDIHGCARELKKLLDKVEFSEETDHLIAVGDVISKGPESSGVLDELIRLNASSVRGNHEDRILKLVPAVLDSAEMPPDIDVTSEKFKKDSELLRHLSKHHLDYLHSMPLMLRIPSLPQAFETSHKTSSPIGEEILVVHAGLVPAVSLEKQDPYFVMNMRSIQTKTHAPMAEAESKKTNTKAWHDIWCWYNDRLFKHKSLKDFQFGDEFVLPPTGGTEWWLDWLDADQVEAESKWPNPQVVVYGHRSKEGLQIERWTKGLDTGCVKGERLTAMVLDAKGEQEIVQVDCKDYR